MASLRSINPFARTNNDTGFGSNVTGTAGRFVNRDGSFNIYREGGGRLSWFSMYYTMLNMPRLKFVLTILAFFLTINVLFTAVYLLLGFDAFQGFVEKDAWGRIRELYYFSMQTYTTVGYGRINPVSDAASLVSGIEAMSGFLGFAWATGMLYGRFIRPRANLRFSDCAIIAPYKGFTGLMFRFVALKEKHTLTGVEVKVNLAMQVEENGEMQYRFFDLPLERARVDSLPMNFTVVHPINSESPLWGMQPADFERADLEIYVLVRAFDDVYSANVQQRTSYTYDELKYGYKFALMFRESENRQHTILEMDKLSELVKADLPAQP